MNGMFRMRETEFSQKKRTRGTPTNNKARVDIAKIFVFYWAIFELPK